VVNNFFVSDTHTDAHGSLDTLDPFKFEFMTRRRGHDAVLRSLDIALASPFLKSVKLNVVVIKGLNDSEVLEFVEMTRNTSLSVRFIEFMPFTGGHFCPFDSSIFISPISPFR
jgi:molybdenum cofactor biosynthesis enzyme MoaA